MDSGAGIVKRRLLSLDKEGRGEVIRGAIEAPCSGTKACGEEVKEAR